MITDVIVHAVLAPQPVTEYPPCHPSANTSHHLQVGQRCYAIGNPFSLDRALTQGIVSGLGRELGAGMGPLGGLPLSISDAIQTDVALNPGNSGGPLLDSNGRVVGVSCAILDPSGRGVNSGVGFAISIDSVRGLVDQVGGWSGY
jgi:S1-C subfamily serine protease